MVKYVCDKCGFVYDPAAGDADSGVPAGTDFPDLPANWVCTLCKEGKENFDKVEV